MQRTPSTSWMVSWASACKDLEGSKLVWRTFSCLLFLPQSSFKSNGPQIEVLTGFRGVEPRRDCLVQG